MEVEVPRLPGESSFERLLTVLIGLTALAAALLTLTEADAGRKAERASATASRLATEATHRLTEPSLSTAARIALILETWTNEFSAVDLTLSAEDDPAFVALAAAEAQVAKRTSDVVSDLTGLPYEFPRLPSGAFRELETSAQDAERHVAALNAQVDRAEEYGGRQSRAVLGLSLAAMAGALFGLAAMLAGARAGWIALGTGAAALMAAVGLGASSWLV